MQKISKHRAAAPYLAVMVKTSASFIGPGDGQRVLGLGRTLLEAGAVAVPLATLAATGISAAYEKMTAASRKAQAFKTMVDQNPHLHDHPADLTQRYFNTLYTLNPELAHDPTVAASFVNNLAAQNNPVMPHAQVFGMAKDLAGMRGAPKPPGFMPTLDAAIARLADRSRQGQIEKMRDQLTSQSEAHREELGSMRTDLRRTQDSMRTEQTRNKILKSYAQKMKHKAQQSGNYP